MVASGATQVAVSIVRPINTEVTLRGTIGKKSCIAKSALHHICYGDFPDVEVRDEMGFTLLTVYHPECHDQIS